MERRERRWVWRASLALGLVAAGGGWSLRALGAFLGPVGPSPRAAREVGLRFNDGDKDTAGRRFNRQQYSAPTLVQDLLAAQSLEISAYDALPRRVSKREGTHSLLHSARKFDRGVLLDFFSSRPAEIAWRWSERLGYEDGKMGGTSGPRQVGDVAGSWVSSGRPGTSGIRRSPCQPASERAAPFCGPPCRSWAPSLSRLASLLVYYCIHPSVGFAAFVLQSAAPWEPCARRGS